MKKEFELSLDEIDNMSLYIDDLIKNSSELIFILRGDLASGKTTLVKNVVKKLGINELVTSPTFSIQSIYGNNIFHYDMYNKSLSQFLALGLIEEFDKKGFHFVEWGDEKLEELLKDYGYNVIVIEIVKKENRRLYKIYA